MHIRTILPIAIALAVSLSTSARAAEFDASFTYDPAAPEPGQIITVTDTTPEGEDPLNRHWDLDGDGEFDNGTEKTVTRKYPAGDHVVKLRVSNLLTGERDIETQTIHVAAPQPPPPPADPDPTPEPTPTAARLRPTRPRRRWSTTCARSSPRRPRRSASAR